ncbi:MAG: hypothetical protein ABI740_05440 [Alphaproteobacteria bacterium]
MAAAWRRNIWTRAVGMAESAARVISVSKIATSGIAPLHDDIDFMVG